MEPAEPVAIVEASTPPEIAHMRELFAEYQHWLGEDLSFQNFSEELDSLADLYAPPGGRLLLARARDGSAAGGVGMKGLEPGICEMKRLYVRALARMRPRAQAGGGGRACGTGRRLRAHAPRHARPPA